MSVGRPPKFKTAEELENIIIEFFKSLEYEVDGVKRWYPATITGLALALGFCDRQSLYDYEKREEFSCTIKKARLMVENSYEKHLFGKNSTGAIFGLKNMGWKDKSEVDQINRNLNAELSEEEKKDALQRIQLGLKELEDYE